MAENLKSDVLAKFEYVKILISEGYNNARVTKSPSDIQATKNGMDFYFEIKYTTKDKKYFGAATLTEWQAAIQHPNTYFFIVALLKENKWVFTKYSPYEFMEFSTIPPFKVFFNIPDTTTKSLPINKETKSVKLSTDNINEMVSFYESMKKSC